MPLTGSGYVLTFYIEGTAIPQPNEEPTSNIRVVSESYFDAMRIPLRAGRVAPAPLPGTVGDPFWIPGSMGEENVEAVAAGFLELLRHDSPRITA